MLRKDNYIKRVFYPLLVRAGLPRVTFQILRHTANSVAIMGGGDVNSVAQRNGHRDGRMVTSTYAHVFAGARDRIANIMESAYGDPSLASEAGGGQRRAKR